jgi:hypothetical protein
MTRALVLSTGLTSVTPAKRACRNVLDTLVTLSLQRLSFMLVCSGSMNHSLDNTLMMIGFMTKIKKLLETVCFNCGKILLDEVSHPYNGGVVHHVLLTFSDF